jgi:beta-lactamase superfamily II metal-dependent hydrolase
MDLKIFDVEHGACALLTCDDNTRLMLDCGHNGDTGWKPGTYLREQGIASIETLAVTNYDEDHVSGADDLFDRVSVGWLWRNKSVSAQTIRYLKSEDGMGPGIDRLVHEIENTYTGTGGGTATPPSFQGLKRVGFSNSYPEFDDENNLSLVVHLNCNGVGVLFPGDLERAGWLKLLERADFREALRNTKVLVASHHGRENGCCEEIFSYCKPYYVVISDKGYMYDTQRTIPFYSKYAIGGPFRGDTRKILTTRRDGRIGFKFDANSWGPY